MAAVLAGTILAEDSQAGLARNLARATGATPVTCTVRTFPDGESKLTVSGTLSGRCTIVQSTHPPVDANLVRLMLMVSEAAGRADGVTAVVPYMGYARQDREFLPGEVVTIKWIANMLAGAGVDRLITVDMHSMKGLEYFGGMAQNVSAVPDLAAHCRNMGLTDPLAVSPDRGGQDRARLFAREMGTDWLALDKERDRRTGEVSVRGGDADVSGRDVILVDDMISTGGSMVKGAAFLKGRGCGRIFAACTHALMVGEAASRIAGAGVVEVVGTNTIPGRAGVVDVSGVIAESL